ncbi:MAG: AraC family transcriptional regulator [Planctomycetota bacterium]
MTIESGQAIVSIDGHRRPLESGQCCLLLPGGHEFFRFDTQAPTRHTWCTMLFDPLPPASTWARPGLSWSRPTPALLAQLIDAGIESQSSRRNPDDPLTRSLGLSALFTFLNMDAPGVGERTSGSVPIDAPLSRACAYISERLTQSMEVRDVAAAAGVTPNHLTRLFCRSLGTTPGRYIWAQRIDYGMMLLRSTGLTIAEIAYGSGFASPFHFSRTIKKRYGHGPRELRRRWWAVDPPATTEADQAQISTR